MTCLRRCVVYAAALTCTTFWTRTTLTCWTCAVLASCLLAGHCQAGDFSEPQAETLSTITQWRSPAPGDVRLGGEIGRRIQVTIGNNILQLDLERDFLTPFRNRNQKGGYVGLGKLLDSVVRFAAHTQDPRLLKLKEQIVAEVVKLQEPDGYIGIMEPQSRMWSLWDVHEMSYLVYALSVDHRFFQTKESLECGRRLADYIRRNWESQPEKVPGGGGITDYMAVTGLENAFLSLAAETGDQTYVDFVVNFRKLPQWPARIVLGRHGPIEGHIYAYLCRAIAQLRLSDLHPQPQLWQPTRQAVDFLLHGGGLVITGECGDHECWHNTQAGTINLGETCATAYLIRLLDELLRREGKSLYGDVMERSIYNGLFAAQSPDGRRIRYYTPFDGPRSYYPHDTYCCPNNYRRIVAELPGFVTYATPNGVAVNLYTSGEFKLQLPSGRTVRIAQETRYPHDGKIVMSIHPEQAETFELRLRIPSFCGQATVLAPGEEQPTKVPAGDWAVLNRTWNPGDRVVLDIPLNLRLVTGRRAQMGRVAVMYGPLVFCLNRKKHDSLKDVDLRLLTINPQTVEGPMPDDSVHPDGLACQVKAWGPGDWYPGAPLAFTLTLTEFPDPDGEAIYFHVPNPCDQSFVADELIVPSKGD